MVIYTNNLAEKLFGFAMSREQLRNTGLCDILEDPNLQLDIDLAIDFNAAIRGDLDGTVPPTRPGGTGTGVGGTGGTGTGGSGTGGAGTGGAGGTGTGGSGTGIGGTGTGIGGTGTGGTGTDGTGTGGTGGGGDTGGEPQDRAEAAAERFTNALILSSAFLDYSTIDFYTSRMVQYPIFEYHVDRIQFIFDNIDNLNDYYAAASAREKNFLDNLKQALKDCLNSPCNLFNTSSESIASIIDSTAASNTTTNFSFSAIKEKTKDFFRTTYGGMKDTLVKQIPDAVTGMVGKMSILGQDAWDQSVNIIFEKDKEKKDKLIANALAGRALDYEATGYTYVPDAEAYTSIDGFAASVLSQAASDLGGCFRKYQHLARYSPWDEDQNLGRTSTEPVQTSTDGNNHRISTGGQTPVGNDKNREEALNCQVPPASPAVTPPGQTVGKTVNFKGTQQEYYTKVYNAVYAAAVAKGLPNPEVIARLGAAQSSLETGYGKSMPAGSNNAFGIKGTGPAGSVSSRTKEVINGQYVEIRDNFRVYNNFEESAVDYVDFLAKNKRYKPVLAAPDVDTAIREIGRSGYATDPRYGSMVKSINDKYK